jgi:hypothetical protein
MTQDNGGESDAEAYSREEICEYLADLTWEECGPCRGTGCAACNHEGVIWEASYGVA